MFSNISAERKPAFWITLAVILAAFVLLFLNFFVGLLWTAISYVFWFGLFGIVLYVADLNTLKLLGRRTNRMLAAAGIALLWAGFRSSGIMSLAGHLILALWSFTILFVSFSVGATLWKNRETIAKRFDDVAHGRANPVDAVRDAASGAGASIKEGAADIRKATIG